MSRRELFRGQVTAMGAKGVFHNVRHLPTLHAGVSELSAACNRAEGCGLWGSTRLEILGGEWESEERRTEEERNGKIANWVAHRELVEEDLRLFLASPVSSVSPT